MFNDLPNQNNAQFLSMIALTLITDSMRKILPDPLDGDAHGHVACVIWFERPRKATFQETKPAQYRHTHQQRWLDVYESI